MCMSCFATGPQVIPFSQICDTVVSCATSAAILPDTSIASTDPKPKLKEAMMIDATINLPSSAQSVDQRSIEHGSAASMLPAVVRAPASPKPKCRKMVVAKGLKMTKVGKGMRPSSGPSEDLRDALKAFEAKTDSHADRLAQIEGHGRVVSATVDLLSASVDSRFAVLAAELNQYAVQIEQGKAAVEASLQAHLARIDSTFQQCDAILGTTQELMSSSPAAAPPATAVPLVFTQDLLASRSNIDESYKKIAAVKDSLEKLEDKHIHDNIAVTAEQAWARKQIGVFWSSLTKVDKTLKNDLEVEFGTVRAELQTATTAGSQAATTAGGRVEDNRK